MQRPSQCASPCCPVFPAVWVPADWFAFRHMQMITDSHYVGDDYDVFGAWLGADKGEEEEDAE